MIINESGLLAGFFHLRVPESSAVGSAVGRIKAHDLDIGKNAEVEYTIVPGDGGTMFDITTNEHNQEGIIILKRVRSLFLTFSMWSLHPKEPPAGLQPLLGVEPWSRKKISHFQTGILHIGMTWQHYHLLVKFPCRRFETATINNEENLVRHLVFITNHKTIPCPN